MTDLVWDSPAIVKWGTATRAETRNFPDLRAALDFVMGELELTPDLDVGVYPDRGSALVNLSIIEQAYRTRFMADGEPGGG